MAEAKKRGRPKGKSKIPPELLSPIHKLTKDMQHSVLGLLGQYKRPKEVADWLKEKHGIVVSSRNIRDNYLNCPKYQEKIQEYRDRWESQIANEIFASKRQRLIKLQEIHEEALIDKVTARNQFGEITKKDLSVALSAIKEARTEIEGVNVNVTVNPVHDLIQEIWDESDGKTINVEKVEDSEDKTADEVPEITGI